MRTVWKHLLRTAATRVTAWLAMGLLLGPGVGCGENGCRPGNVGKAVADLTIQDLERDFLPSHGDYHHSMNVSVGIGNRVALVDKNSNEVIIWSTDQERVVGRLESDCEESDLRYFGDLVAIPGYSEGAFCPLTIVNMKTLQSWRLGRGLDREAIAVAAGKVFVADRTSRISAHRVDDGSEIWTTVLDEHLAKHDGRFLTAAALVIGKLLIVVGHYGSIHAIELSTGEVQWKYGTQELQGLFAFRRNPSLHGTNMCVDMMIHDLEVSADGLYKLLCLDITSGNVAAIVKISCYNNLCRRNEKTGDGLLMFPVDENLLNGKLIDYAGKKTLVLWEPASRNAIWSRKGVRDVVAISAEKVLLDEVENYVLIDSFTGQEIWTSRRRRPNGVWAPSVTATPSSSWWTASWV